MLFLLGIVKIGSSLAPLNNTYGIALAIVLIFYLGVGCLRDPSLEQIDSFLRLAGFEAPLLICEYTRGFINSMGFVSLMGWGCGDFELRRLIDWPEAASADFFIS